MVLVVAANARFRRSLREVFEQAQYDVLEAADGTSARKLLELWHPSAIVIDGSAPDGWQLVAILKRAANESTPLIFLADEAGGNGSTPLRVVRKPQLGGELSALADVMTAVIGPGVSLKDSEPPESPSVAKGQRPRKK